jgi:hypothetical protein
LTVDVQLPKKRIEGLEEELEKTEFALFLQQGIACSQGNRLSAADFLTEIGMGEFIEQIPQGASSSRSVAAIG